MISDCWIGKVLETCSCGLIEVHTIPAFAWRDRGNCTNPSQDRWFRVQDSK